MDYLTLFFDYSFFQKELLFFFILIGWNVLFIKFFIFNSLNKDNKGNDINYIFFLNIMLAPIWEEIFFR